MAIDFVDVVAHSVAFIRCIKAYFRTHPGVHCFGIFMLSSKITIHESFLGLQKIKRILAYMLYHAYI